MFFEVPKPIRNLAEASLLLLLLAIALRTLSLHFQPSDDSVEPSRYSPETVCAFEVGSDLLVAFILQGYHC